MSRLESLSSVVPSQCLWGKLQNLSLSNVSKQVVMSFCVAGMALRDIPTCFKTCQKSSFVAGAILLRRFQKMRCIFRGRRSTLDISDVILRGRRSTLDVSCCVFSANRIVSAARSGDKLQFCGRGGILSQVMKNDGSVHIDFEAGRHFTLHALHSPLYT